jgi:hypothetical protein
MASRKEQKEALRAERERKAQEAAAAERRKRMVGFVTAGVLVAAAVIALVVVLVSSGGGDDGGDMTNAGGDRAAEPTDDFPQGTIPKASQTNLEAAAKAAKCKVQTFDAEGRNHVDGTVQYKQNPPTSGDHNEFAAEDGSYLVAPQFETLVHSLEHGRVILWYQPNAPAQLKGQVKALFDEDNFHMIAVPNDRKMPSQIAASSWTRSITCPEVNNSTWDALRLFRDRYRDQAPEQVP